MTEPLVAFRAPTPACMPFVFDSWIKSYWKSGPSCSLVPFHVFHHEVHALLEALLPKCEVLLAVNPDDEAQILGWVCREGNGVVHYCYVKEPFRRFRIASMLLQHTFERAWEHVDFVAKDAVLTYSHRTDVCSRLPIPEGWVYNPFKR